MYCFLKSCEINAWGFEAFFWTVKSWKISDFFSAGSGKSRKKIHNCDSAKMKNSEKTELWQNKFTKVEMRQGCVDKQLAKNLESSCIFYYDQCIFLVFLLTSGHVHVNLHVWKFVWLRGLTTAKIFTFPDAEMSI